MKAETKEQKEQKEQGRKIAAIYARTSKEDKNDKKVSIEQQIEDGKTLAAKNGFIVPDNMIFIDRDLSGKLYPDCWLEKKGKSRKGFSNLIEQIEAGNIQGLVIRSRDRIARNTILSLRFYEMMNQNKIDLFATGEAIFAANDASGRFALTVVIAAYQMQLEKIQSDCKASFDYRKRNRLNLCGSKCLGYTNKDSEIVVEPIEAELVNRIFDMYLNGTSINDITRFLNRDYLHLRKGCAKVYHHTTVSAILKNPNYVNEGVQPYPVIMEKEKWLAAQSSWKSRVNIKCCVTKKQHLISGFLKCQYCGKNLTAYARQGETVFKCREGKHNEITREVNEVHYNEFLDKVIASAKILTLKAETKEAVELEFKRDRIEKNISDLKAEFMKGDNKDLSFSLFMEMKSGIEKELNRISKAIMDIHAETMSRKNVIKEWNDLTFVEKRERIDSIVDCLLVGEKGIFLKYRKSVEGFKELFNEMHLFFPFTSREVHKGKRKQRAILPKDFDRSNIPYVKYDIVDGMDVMRFDNEAVKAVEGVQATA